MKLAKTLSKTYIKRWTPQLMHYFRSADTRTWLGVINYQSAPLVRSRSAQMCTHMKLCTYMYSIIEVLIISSVYPHESTVLSEYTLSTYASAPMRESTGKPITVAQFVLNTWHLQTVLQTLVHAIKHFYNERNSSLQWLRYHRRTPLKLWLERKYL